MLEASRRADIAERQLQRRESEARHLTQKQACTEQALSELQEQHAQAAAAAAACQLVMHVSTHAHTWARPQRMLISYLTIEVWLATGLHEGYTGCLPNIIP